jgi:hypothetical protein
MKSIIVMIIIGSLSVAAGLNHAMLAISGEGAVMWMLAAGSIAAGAVCVLAAIDEGFDDAD